MKRRLTDEEVRRYNANQLLRRRRLNLQALGSLGGAPETPWWLAGGLIPESTNYTIYDPLAAADQATSYSNLANPGTRDANPVVAPTWSAGTGWTFNGTTQYINSQTNFLTNHTIVCWHDDWAGVYSFGSSKLLSRPLNSPNCRFTLTTNTDLTSPSTNSIIALRTSQGIYRNGKKLASLGSFPAGTEYPVFIGARNNVGTAANFGSGGILRYAHYDFALSGAQCEALFESMKDYQQPAASSYESVVMGLSPLVYYPMTQKYGKFFIDRTGKKANAEVIKSVTTISLGNDGPTGKGFAAGGGGNANNFIQTQDTDWATLSTLNLDEFSVSFWIKNINANAQARPCNIYSNAGNEYWALEIRSGNIQVYSKENGVTWDTGTLASTTNNTWQHIVGFNSKSQNKIGFYLNGVKYEATKGTTGFLDTSPDTYFPYILQSMTGFMNHVAFFDHALTQGEVDTLYV